MIKKYLKSWKCREKGIYWRETKNWKRKEDIDEW